jgi:hypothetical protein
MACGRSRPGPIPFARELMTQEARLVQKPKTARERKRATGMKVEGRKSWAEIIRPGPRSEAATSMIAERASAFAA